MRPNTILIRYDDMMENLPTIVAELGLFLGREVKTTKIPDRESIAGVDGHWVRGKHKRKTPITSAALELFNRVNEEKMREMGYIN